jgi:RimJ/RimL family protein N-acetyltransferase
MPAPLGSARLRLREFLASDRAALVAMHRMPRVRELLVDDAPMDHPVVVQEFIARMQRYYRAHEGLGIWCAERWAAPMSAQALSDPELRSCLSEATWLELSTPVPRFAGWFNLMRMPHDPEAIEIGCRLLPAEWGTRLVFEGGRQLLDHAFGSLRLPRVFGVCHPAHRSVHQVLQALGFAEQGERDYDGAPASWFSIDAGAWQAARERPLRSRLRATLETLARAHPSL